MQKAVKKIRVECDDLAIGMYVCELDRPWLDSPFLIQGFYIKDIDDIDTVRNVCDYVYVDKLIEQSKLNNSLPGASSALLLTTNYDDEGDAKSRTRLSRPADENQPKRPYGSEQGIEDFFPERKLCKYTNTHNWRGESKNARRAVSDLYGYITRFMESFSDGAPIDMKNLSRAVEPMVDSVIRNPDACLWWTAVKPPIDLDKDSALRASVFAVVLGRQLGLPRHDLHSLAIGGMLFDIGKLRLSDGILQVDRRLTSKEMSIMQRHVEVGLDILKRGGLADPDILDFIANHHERLDGSGYPKGLAGDRIPAFGRIAGVVDVYNAITSSRKYASSRSPAEAINQLYKLKGVHFHKDLIEEFVQAMGVYPVGALVELSSGEVVIVVAQSGERRLRPLVVVLLDRDKNQCQEGRYIDLAKTTHSKDGRKLDIVKNLEPNAYGLDLSKIRIS